MNIAEGSDMEMMDFLEADKEQLMSGLRSAGSPEKAQNVVEKEFDRLLLRYNEECEILTTAAFIIVLFVVLFYQ